MAFLSWILSALFVILLVGFAVLNMGVAEVIYSPFHPPIKLSLSIVVLISMAFGALFGGFYVWCEHGPLSRKADKKRAQVYDLIKENKKIKDDSTLKDQVTTPLLEGK